MKFASITFIFLSLVCVGAISEKKQLKLFFENFDKDLNNQISFDEFEHFFSASDLQMSCRFASFIDTKSKNDKTCFPITTEPVATPATTNIITDISFKISENPPPKLVEDDTEIAIWRKIFDFIIETFKETRNLEKKNECPNIY